MSEFVDYGTAVFFIRQGDDTSWIHKKQDEYDQMDKSSRLIYVSIDGCDDKYLHAHRFLTENYEHSLLNHMRWNGLFDSEEQMDYMVKQIREFQTTGKQLLVEEVDFKKEYHFDYTTGKSAP